MKTDVYSRMYSHIEDLIPGISDISSSDGAFYAPPKSPLDMALFCSISSCNEDILQLELTKDEVAHGVVQKTQWMKFELDRKHRKACLLAYQTESGPEYVQYETVSTRFRGVPLNCFAVNWLGILVNLQFAFRSTVSTASLI